MRRTHRGSLQGLVCVLAFVAAGGCAQNPEGGPVSDYSWSWSYNPAASEVVTTEDVVELGREADVVALGRFTEVCEPRRVGGSGGDGQTYGCLTFISDSVLAGDGGLLAGGIPVEFMGTPAEAGLPSSPSVVFLLDKGGVEAGRFRVVNSAGLYSTTARAAVDRPLREHAPASQTLEQQGLHTGSWEGFVSSVRERLSGG